MKLIVTLELDQPEIAERYEFDLADIGQLHPDSDFRPKLRETLSGEGLDQAISSLARRAGVYDPFVDAMRDARDTLGQDEFNELMADMDPVLRPSLVAAGLLEQ